MSEGSEQRGAARFEASQPFHATAGGVEFEGLLKDISKTGAALEVAFPLKEGQVLEIDVEDVGKLTARVARTVEDRAGVQFTKTAKDDSKNALANFGIGEKKEPMGEGSERRGADRFEASHPFHAIADGVEFEGPLKDISETGAALEMAFPLKEGQDFEIDIEDAGKLTARVARTVEGRAGVRFTKTAKEASRDALAYFGAGEEKEPIDRILKMINS